MPLTEQLRTYTVKEGLLDEWVERWREEIVPLRLEFGFRLDGAWIDRERNQFIWTIAYEGEETFEERNSRYWDSDQRKRMRVNPDDYLVRTEKREVTRIY